MSDSDKPSVMDLKSLIAKYSMNKRPLDEKFSEKSKSVDSKSSSSSSSSSEGIQKIYKKKILTLFN